jgi:hypothetical protein
MIYTCTPHFLPHFLSPSYTEALWYQNSLFQFQGPTAYIFNSNLVWISGYSQSDTKPQFVVTVLIIAVHTILGYRPRLPPIIINCTRISINSTNVNNSLAASWNIAPSVSDVATRSLCSDCTVQAELHNTQSASRVSAKQASLRRL